MDREYLELDDILSVESGQTQTPSEEPEQPAAKPEKKKKKEKKKKGGSRWGGFFRGLGKFLLILVETALLNNCSPEETDTLTAYAEDFIDHYVAFTGSALKSSERSYKALMEYVVPDSELANRMALALEGLEWAQSRGDELVSATMNMIHRIEDGIYLCDVTYQVDTTGREGVVRTTNSARFIVVEDDDELLVKTLVAY